MRRTVALAVLALVGLALLLALGRGLGAAGEGGWAEVRRGDLVLGAEVTGTLRAEESSYLGPPVIPDRWDFKIAHLAPEGARVRADEVVLAFDATELEVLLEQRRAERDQAAKEAEKKQTDLARQLADGELRLAEAEARLRKARLKVSGPSEVVALVELEQARVELDLATREVAYLAGRSAALGRQGEAELAALVKRRERAAERVRELEGWIDRMRVRAPRDGTVIYTADHRGEKKRVGDSVWRGHQVLEIPDLARMMGEAEVDEAEAGRIAEGQPVVLRLDAHPDVEFSGVVRSIRRTVEKKSWRNPLKVMRLTLALAETDTRRMRPGMRFRGRVETERVPDVLLVPAEAVFTDADGPLVFRRRWTGFERIRPRLGRRSEAAVEVLAGLDQGEQVALVDLDREAGRR